MQIFGTKNAKKMHFKLKFTAPKREMTKNNTINRLFGLWDL